MSAADEICVVVDTNVLAVAEGLHDQATEECRAACLQIASKIQAGLPITVDAGDLILMEYIKTLKESDTAGIGKKLAHYLFRRRHDPQVCRRVTLTPADEIHGSFDEIPATLRNFDVDDHVFIAVAAAEGSRTQIFQALDKEWWDRKQDFVDSGIDVQFLCALDLISSIQQQTA